MLKPSNPKARRCYEHSVEARQRALQAKTTTERDDFLAIEKSWLKLAESYEFSERLDRFANKDFPKHPICPSCAVPMWLVEMNSIEAVGSVLLRVQSLQHTELLSESDLDWFLLLLPIIGP